MTYVISKGIRLTDFGACPIDIPYTTYALCVANITVIPGPGSKYNRTSVYLYNSSYSQWHTLYEGGFTSGKGSYIYSQTYFPVTIYPTYEQAVMLIEVLVPQ